MKVKFIWPTISNVLGLRPVSKVTWPKVVERPARTKPLEDSLDDFLNNIDL